MNHKNVVVIGAGLAGSEAAWQLANRGIHVDLYEMRPVKSSPAHQTDQFAELVCSNSLRAGNIENAVGLLKEEMRRLGSIIMECADATAVPAGGALAVDRHLFSEMVTEKVKSHPNINFFIYGHRHIELDLMLSATARILILGDWINFFSYAVFDGENLFLENYIEGETQL